MRKFDFGAILSHALPIVFGIEAQFSKSSGQVKKARAVSGLASLFRLLGFPVGDSTEAAMGHAVDDVVQVLNDTGVFSRKAKPAARKKK